MCLIPSSAHGTNAATAVMAGMRVVVVACDDDGNVDLDDLEAKVARARRATLAALMVTYPSTHGVYEERDPRDLRDRARARRPGVPRRREPQRAASASRSPAKFGADVSHLNLHKTFCIPHGGGGPGVGPVACARTSRRSCRTTRCARGRRRRAASAPVIGGAVGLGRHPADLVGVHRA